MATFAKAAFDSTGYAAVRPTYPQQLFDFIFQYHDKLNGGKWHTAIDLECGTG